MGSKARLPDNHSFAIACQTIRFGLDHPGFVTAKKIRDRLTSMQIFKWNPHRTNSAPLLCIALITLCTTMLLPQSGRGQSADVRQPSVDTESVGFGFKELSHLEGATTPKSAESYQATIRRITNPASGSQDADDSSYSSQSALNNDRVKSIHERIKLLERLIAEEKSTSETPGVKFPGSIPSDNADSKTPPVRTPENVPPFPPAQDDLPLSPDGELPNADSETSSIPQPTVTGTPVTALPVNSFELGNSLFLTGNLTASRKSYQSSLKQAQSPDEDAWLRCLIGSCYRLEGDLANAETMYREVTQHKNQSYPVDYAKWCLQYVEQKRNTREQFRLIEAEIETLRKEPGKR
jgi:hypothetical protein